MLSSLPPVWRRLLRITGTAVVTVVVLALVLRAIRPADLGETMSDVSPPLVLAAAAAAFGFILCRAWRYRLLLAGTHGRFGTLLAITLSGWGVSLLLPGPGGDAALVVLLRRRLQVGLTVGAGAALLSRLLDVASLLVLALVMAPFAGVRLPGVLLVGGMLIAGAIVVGLTALFWDRPRGQITGWLERLSLPAGLHQRIHSAVEELGSGSRPLLLITATAGARLATGLQYLALFAAIDQPLSLVQVWFALSVRTLLLAIPIQGLGGLGTGQLWWTAGLTLLGWPVDEALAASLAVHLLDLCVSLPQAGIGALLLFRRPAEPDRVPAMAGAALEPD
ncbi:MAG: flippase-like domain-containing protein [Chloroflexi bacterium]|nr:MAG: flippase-like domain-containing protein [Chloroflexota bacterium]TME47337.1 MAG: flippase-like domain-containing protein [Chloroflexota bacterium]